MFLIQNVLHTNLFDMKNTYLDKLPKVDAFKGALEIKLATFITDDLSSSNIAMFSSV